MATSVLFFFHQKPFVYPLLHFALNLFLLLSTGQNLAQKNKKSNKAPMSHDI